MYDDISDRSEEILVETNKYIEDKDGENSSENDELDVDKTQKIVELRWQGKRWQRDQQ